MPSHLGIDQSYTGCAIVLLRDDPTLPAVRVMDFSQWEGEGPCTRLKSAYHRLRSYFRAIDDLEEVAGICFEGYSFGSRYKREAMGELGGILRVALVDVFHEPILTTVAPSTVKKYATGSGNAPKDKVMLHVYKRWNFTAETNDCADAYTLARIARALDGADEPEIMAQEEVLATLRKAKAVKA